MEQERGQALLAMIEAYDTVILSRHIRPDGDALGASLGLRAMLRATYPEKAVYAVGDDRSEDLAFLGEEDAQLPDEVYREALLISLDTATTERISNAKAPLAKETVKLDHHLNTAPYGDFSYIDSKSSSTCEMLVELWLANREKLVMTTESARCLFCGMVTDSGRFRYPSTTPATLTRAASLLGYGFDLETLYSNLYLEPFSQVSSRASILRQVKLTEHGAAYLILPQTLQKELGLSNEEASKTVNDMDSIRDCIVWLAILQNENGSWRVRLRSRLVPVNSLAEKWRGGGHPNASGATLYNEEEIRQFLADADCLIGAYKESHTGWL